jgi:hypothetical protein
MTGTFRRGPRPPKTSLTRTLTRLRIADANALRAERVRRSRHRFTRGDANGHSNRDDPAAYKPAVNLETNRSADSPDGRETTTAAFIDPPTRDEMIARAAYFRAERRGFAEGCALQDWLEAEVEVDSKLSR